MKIVLHGYGKMGHAIEAIAKERGHQVIEIFDENRQISAEPVRQGDVIISFDGKEIKDARQLQLVVAETPIGKTVVVEVFRDGRTQKLNLTIGNADSAAAAKPRSTEADAGWLGLTVEELPQNKRLRGLAGVLVTGVDPEGVAAEAGIQRGDVIVSVNQKRTGSLKEYATAMTDAERRGAAALLVRRGDASIYFALKIR